MIMIQQLTKSYSQQTILDIPKWTVKQGDQVALLGPSGCGKSTLLHILGGVLTAEEGIVTVANQTISTMSEVERDHFRSKHIGYIFQDFYLIPSLTAKENIEWAFTTQGSSIQRKQLIEQWFERVGLSSQMNRYPSQLSRGQQQRVAMIRALIHKPPLVLADEPTGSLDWETASHIMQLLLDLSKENGMTLVTVTHDLHLAALYPTTVHMTAINETLKQATEKGVIV